MPKRPKKPGKTKPAETASAEQIVFDFGPKFAAPALVARPVSRRAEPEVIPPSNWLEPVEPRRLPRDSVDEVAGSKHTHIFGLHLRAHDMMIRAAWVFWVCVVLIVFLKGGVPLQEVGYGAVRLPANNKFVTGVLGLLAIFFAVAVINHAIRAWDLLRLAGIPSHKTGTMVSKVLFVVQAGAFALAVIAAVLFTYKDVFELLRLIFFNAIVYPDGIPNWR